MLWFDVVGNYQKLIERVKMNKMKLEYLQNPVLGNNCYSFRWCS